MPLELVTVPCLKDNYAYLVHDPDSGKTALIDVPEAAPILVALAGRGWALDDIWITHHHGDHIDGVAEVRAATGARVVGAAADAHRLPALDLAVGEGSGLTFGRHAVAVIDVPGHTLGHVAYHFSEAGLVFTADSLMGAGCGRLFEGTPAQMWDSLSKLMALPPETLVCSGHEYTLSNLRFALALEPDEPALISRLARVEALRHEGRPSVPVTLSEELESNPFLRARLPQTKARLGMAGASDAAVFAEMRARKDRF